MNRDNMQERVRRIRIEGRGDILIIELLEELLSVITEIQAQLDEYETGVAGVFTAIDAALTNLAAKIAALEASGVNPDEVAALQADLSAATALVAPELAKVQAADPGAAPAPAPVPVADPTQPPPSV